MGFFYTQSDAKPKKNEWGTLGEIFFRKKSRNAKNTEKGDPLVSSGIHSVAKYQISKKLKGDPLEEKNFKVSQCRKTERVDPLRFFNIHSVAKHEKIEENKNFHFREKISQCRKKTERGDSLGFFNIHSVAKHQKKYRGDPLGKKFFSKKSLAVPKKMKGGSLWSRPVWYVTRKNRKNLFGSVR